MNYSQLVFVAIILAVGIGHAAAGYGYNITVALYADGSKENTGKMYVYLYGPGFQHEIQLQPHMTALMPGMAYSFYADAPAPLDQVSSIAFKWRRKALWNTAPKYLPVKRVSLDPTYLPYPARQASLRHYCGAFYTKVDDDRKVMFAQGQCL